MSTDASKNRKAQDPRKAYSADEAPQELIDALKESLKELEEVYSD